jgi:hypothetical protein
LCKYQKQGRNTEDETGIAGLIYKQIKETRRLLVAALTMEEKPRHQKEIKRLESARDNLIEGD